MEALLIARMNAADGRRDEFEQWYTHVHLRDALRMPGSLAAQRFRRHSAHNGERRRFTYLTVYDVIRPEQFAQAHDDAAGTDALVMSSAADLTEVSVHHYYPTTVLDGESDAGAGSALLVEFEQPTPATRSDAKDLLAAAWAAMPGGERWRGFVAAYEPRAQMFRRPPESRLLCLAQFRCPPAQLPDHLHAVLDGLPGGARAEVFEPASPVLTKAGVLAEGITPLEAQARRRALADPADAWARHRRWSGPGRSALSR